MTKHLADDLWIHTCTQQQSRAGVTQIVKANIWQCATLQQGFEGPHHIAREERCPNAAAKDEIMVLPGAPHEQPFFDLACLMFPQRFKRGQGKCNLPPRALGLGLSEHPGAIEQTLQLDTHPYNASIEIDIRPAQAQQLRLAHPRRDCQHALGKRTSCENNVAN